MKIVACVPIKMKSQRIENKNFILLGNKPLCSHLFSTLASVRGIDEKYVYCSDDRIKKYIPNGLVYLKRNKILDGFEVKALDIVNSFAHDVIADIYIFTHVTAPFMKRQSFETALNKVLSEGYDSAFSARKIKGYCWFKGKIINYDPMDIVTTQNVKSVYCETGGFYIFKREVIADMGMRIGKKPYIHSLDDYEGIDIDTYPEYLYAQFAFESLRKA